MGEGLMQVSTYVFHLDTQNETSSNKLVVFSLFVPT